MLINHQFYRNLLILIFLSFSGTVFSQNNADVFDWQHDFAQWDDLTIYSKEYVVDQRHRNASDTNPGTYDMPLKTINRALELVLPGEKVLIHTGIYREKLIPLRGGKSENKMISIVAAPGNHVIIKGSKPLNANWKQRKIYTDVVPDTLLTYSWSRKTWVTTVDDSFFEDNYYPFKLPNIHPDEHQMMPWAHLVKDIPPFTTKRALLFQNGKRMTQLEDYGDLNKLPGSFWIDKDDKTVHIHSFDGGNPNNSFIEVAVKDQLLKPNKVGLNYIRLSGLTFEHCANGFLRTSTGAITSLGGHHWIIENNTIRHINSSGLEFGYLPYEFEDPRPDNPKRKSENSIGFVIVRNNTIYDCGTAGIRSFVVTDGQISNNHIYDCGWQDAENYWECSGIKMLVTYRTLVSNNHIHDIQGGNGIWLDWDIRYSRITGNLIHDIQNIQGGIFIEASHLPNLIDNNVVWNIDGNGIYANDTDFLMVYHNLVGNITGNVVHAIVQTDRNLNGRKLTAEKNLIYNNIFINGLPMKFSSTTNKSDYNLFVSTKEPNKFSLAEMQSLGLEKHSTFIRAQVSFDSSFNALNWLSDEIIFSVPLRSEVKLDFFNFKRPKEENAVGPFINMPKQFIKILIEDW